MKLDDIRKRSFTFTIYVPTLPPADISKYLRQFQVVMNQRNQRMGVTPSMMPKE